MSKRGNSRKECEEGLIVYPPRRGMACTKYDSSGFACSRNLYVGARQYLPDGFARSELTTDEAEKQISQLKAENEAQKLENEELRKKLKKAEELKISNTVTCSMCGFVEKEDRMNICTTCAKKNENIEVKKGEKIEKKKGFDIDKLAICSTCVLKNHVGAEHKIVQFYPVLASTKADKYSSTFMELREKMRETKENLNNAKNKLFENLEIVDENFQNMFDLVKRSKSSKTTDQLICAIWKRYEEVQKSNKAIQESIEFHTAKSIKNTEKLTEENKKLDEELCLKEIGKDDWQLNISKMTIEEKEDEAEN